MTGTRRFLTEALVLIVAAVICATVANAVASRERKVALVGSYPNALNVPSEAASPTPARPTANAAELISPRTEPTLPSSSEITEPSGDESTDPSMAETTPRTDSSPALSVQMNHAPSSATPAEMKPAPAPPAAVAAPKEETMLDRFSPTPDVPWVEISGEEARWLHDRGALFLDARRTRDYENGHIAGARSFAVWEADVDDKVAALADQVKDQKQPVVVYCSGGDCEDSHMLAQKLWGMFFNNVLVYRDGFPDWQQRGGSVQSGSNP